MQCLKTIYREMQPNVRAALQVTVVFGLLWVVSEILINFDSLP